MNGRPYVGAFGKVPQMGDFVRVRANAEPQATFEKWIEQAMAFGAAKRGAAWNAALDRNAIHAFVYRPPASAKSAAILAGAVRASHDAVNRKFPLVVFAPIEEKAVMRSPHLLPLWLGDFLEQATQCLLASPSTASVADFEARVGQVVAPNIVGSTSQDYNEWTHETRMQTVWNTIYGAAADTAPIHAVSTIVEALKPFVGTESPSTPLSVRVPLGRGGAASAAVWIDVVRRIAHWQTTVPTFFWSFDGERGSMILQLGNTPASSLADIWAPDPNSEHVCELESAPKGSERSRLLGRVPRALADVFEHTDVRVDRFLATLSH